MLKINTTSKYAELKFEDKSDLYPLNEISYTVENESETVSFYNRFYKKIVTEQISNIQVNDVPVTRDNIQSLLSVLFVGYESSGGGDVDLSNYYTKPETNTLLDNKVDKVSGKGLSTEDYTTAEKSKLAGLENYDDAAVKGSIAANTAAIEAEVTRAKAAESTINKKIPTVQTSYLGNDKNFVYSEYNTGSTKNVISKLDTYCWERGVYIRSYGWGNNNSALATIQIEPATKETAGIMANYDRINLDYLAGYVEVTTNENGKLYLVNDAKYQYTVITGNTSISLPYISYDKYKELHLIFEGVTGSTITFLYDIIWKEAPSKIIDGATYEFIFTWVKLQNKWYGGYIKYE